MQANPPLLDLLVDICGTRARARPPPRRQRRRARRRDQPRLLPARSRGAAELRAELAERLRRAADYEAALNAARVWMQERHFRIGVHLLRGIAEPEAAAAAYSAVAEAVIGALWPVGHRRLRHAATAPPPGAGAVVVAMGKLGSREMTVSSDLDLIVIYDAEGAEASDGKPAARHATVYYARLTQALIAALSAPMAEGILYKVDMRLRPSGRSGPVATSLAAFRRYQAEEAWTWEHLALTRARVVAGPAALGDGGRRRHRRGPRRAARRRARLLADAADMRRRLAEAHEAAAANPWEVKLGPGRMMDIELLAQTGALLHEPAGTCAARAGCSPGSARSAGSPARTPPRSRPRSPASPPCSRSAASPATTPSTPPRAAPASSASCSPPPASPTSTPCAAASPTDAAAQRRDHRRRGWARA